MARGQPSDSWCKGDGRTVNRAPPPLPPTIDLATQEDEWTILWYAAGDANTEHAIIKDLGYLENVDLASVGINVVMMLDRSEDPYGSVPKSFPLGNWTDTGVGKLVYDGSEGVSTAFVSWGEQNTGNPDTLVRFVEYGKRAAPAKRYMLVMSGHGAGWGGFGMDDSSEDPHLKEPYLWWVSRCLIALLQVNSRSHWMRLRPVIPSLTLIS